MTSMKRFMCWNREWVNETVHTEAPEASRSVFLATHAPLRISRRDASRPDDSEHEQPVSEDQVLEDFLERDANNGILVMPVIGASGSGKSHLVRWVKERMPQRSDRVVIYLPKIGTSLAQVINALLGDRTGHPFDEIRKTVNRSSATETPETLAKRLLFSLSLVIPQSAAEGDDRTVTRMRDEKAGLPLLLQDPVFTEHLLQPGRLIPRLAAELLQGRDEHSGDRPTLFTPDDLPVSVADAENATTRAKGLYRQLVGMAQLQQAALTLLNRCINAAVMDAMHMKGGQLQQAMSRMREQLLAEGKEIVLLVEDFVLLQGVERDLLEAITETAVRDGVRQLATVRTLLAVTTGYYKSLTETVMTRARASTPYVYTLDATFTAQKDDPAVQDFVSRYLNAARLGESRLTRELHDDHDGSGDIPNACDECPVREECHSAFGRSSSGHGLYPFNPPALRRAVASRTGKLFNPRHILSDVLRRTLIDFAAEIRDGTFPSRAFADAFPAPSGVDPLPGPVQAAISRTDRVNGERRTVLLEFWGDAPSEVVNLNDDIHEAFDLPKLPDTDSLEPEPAKEPEKRPAPPSRPHNRQEADPHIDDVENWITRRHALPSPTARLIRSAVRNAVIARASWTHPVQAEPGKTDAETVWPQSRSVVIPDSQGGGTQENQVLSIPFERDPETADFFKAILHATRGGSTWAAQPGGARHYRRLAALADHYAPVIEAAIAERRRRDTSDHMAGLVATALTALAMDGAVIPGQSVAELTAVLVRPIDTLEPAKDGRCPQWINVADLLRDDGKESQAFLCKAVGIAKGTGAPQLWDVGDITPIVAEFARTWTTSPRIMELLDRRTAQRMSAVRPAAVAQAKYLRDWVTAVREHLPQDVTPAALLDKLETAVGKALQAGTPPEAPVISAQDVEAARAVPWKLITSTERDLEHLTEDDLACLLEATARSPGDGPQRITTFLDQAATWAANALGLAALQRDPDTEGLVSQYRACLDRWSALLEDASDES